MLFRSLELALARLGQRRRAVDLEQRGREDRHHFSQCRQGVAELAGGGETGCWGLSWGPLVDVELECVRAYLDEAEKGPALRFECLVEGLVCMIGDSDVRDTVQQKQGKRRENGRTRSTLST